MDEQLKKFIYHKNGWDYNDNTKPSIKRNPNIRGESIGKLWLDGKIFAIGSFSLLQKKKKEYCKNYGISKERALKRFKITY